MRPLRYSINVTLDGCCDHRVFGSDDEVHELHQYASDGLARNDALLLGRVTYEMMESAFRSAAPVGEVFADTINPLRKYVVSSVLQRVDWNAELMRGDLGDAVRALKQQPGKGIGLGGVMLPMALAELGLIDEYEFVVHPRIAGHGPSLFAGLTKLVELQLVGRHEFQSGAVALQYKPR